MLSTGAFNALLKTLEEPPEHAIFVLATTELQKVPLTIISRCQTLEFKKIDDLSMSNKLNEIAKKEKININESGISEIIKNSNGGLRDAIGLLEKANSYADNIDENIIKEISGNVVDKEIENFIKLIENNKLDQLLEIINDYYNSGIDLIKFGNSLINYLRDKMIESKDYNKKYCDLIIDIDDTINKMQKSENPKILFEIALINNLIKINSNSTQNKIEQNIEQSNTKIETTMIKESKDESEKSNSIDDDFKSIRVGNTLCNPKKNIVIELRNNWGSINDLAFDEKYGNIARILSSDVLPAAASDTNLIFMSKLNGIANQLNNDIESVEKIVKKIYLKEYRIICLSKQEWDNYTQEYKNDKSKFIYKEEIKKEKKKDSLKEKAKELFDD